jgi:cytochrome c
MYSKLLIPVAAFLWAVAGPAQAADDDKIGADLAQAKNCLACHQIGSRRVGPPFLGVAARYAGQAESEDYLAGSIRTGGKGRWGAVPMPAQPRVSQEEAHALARWILALKPGD